MDVVSMIKCPQCGFAREETMPVSYCQILYECITCKAVLKPKPGDCCVFCSYGNNQCPPKQGEEKSTS